MFRRISRISVSLVLMMLMLISAGTVVMADAPAIEDIEHKGKGRVEVDFYGKVKYNNCKVTVKDNYGKKYTVNKIRKDDDDISFTIKNFKPGRVYSVTVKGVKLRGTKNFGKVSGTLGAAYMAPAPGQAQTSAPAASVISGDQAIQIAEQHAAATWGTTGFYDIGVESDRYAGTDVWEVSFNGIAGSTVCDHEYKISKNGGSILKYEMEIDD